MNKREKASEVWFCQYKIDNITKKISNLYDEITDLDSQLQYFTTKLEMLKNDGE